jgi:tetratricopeptide (TPR) repeat protein
MSAETGSGEPQPRRADPGRQETRLSTGDEVMPEWPALPAFRGPDLSDRDQIRAEREAIRDRLQRVIDAGSPGWAEAALELGALFAEWDNPGRAGELFQRVAESGHAEHAPTAWRLLGRSLEEHRDLVGAEAAYRRAIDSGHPDAGPRALYALGLLLDRRRDDAAAALFRQAALSRHPDVAIPAASFVSRFFGTGIYAELIEQGDPVVAPEAMVVVGGRLRAQGDLDGAQELLERAVASGHPPAVASASLELGDLFLLHRLDPERARSAYLEALRAGLSYAAVRLVELAESLSRHGEDESARVVFQDVVDAGLADQLPRALLGLGKLLERRGDAIAAWATYQQVLVHRDSDEAIEATCSIATLLERQGLYDQALALYRSVARERPRTGDEDLFERYASAVHMARAGIGRILQRQGSLAEARATYLAEGASSPEATIMHAILQEQEGNLAGARATYERHVDPGPGIEVYMTVIFRFAVFLERHGDVAAAGRLFDRVSSNQDAGMYLSWGRWFARLFDYQGARAAYHRGAAFRDTPEANAAERELERLEGSRDDAAWLHSDAASEG